MSYGLFIKLLKEKEDEWQNYFAQNLQGTLQSSKAALARCQQCDDEIKRLIQDLQKEAFDYSDVERCQQRYLFLATQLEQLEAQWQDAFDFMLREQLVNQGGYENEWKLRDKQITGVVEHMHQLLPDCLLEKEQQRVQNRCHFLKAKQKHETEIWRSLGNALRNSSIPQRGDYENAHETKKRNLQRLENLLNKFPDETPIGALNIYFAVLVSNSTQVAANLGDLYEELLPNRYCSTGNPKAYRPFKDQAPIDPLIRFIMDKFGYPEPKIHYLNKEPIGNELMNSFANLIFVPDGFSLCTANISIAQRFDKSPLLGIIVPTCGSLAHNDRISKYLEDKILTTFVYSQTVYGLASAKSSSFYNPHSLNINHFAQSIKNLLHDKFPISRKPMVLNSMMNSHFYD